MPVPRAGRVVALAASCVAAVSLLAACGGSGKPAAAADTRTNAAGIQAYTACLSQHGVTLPSRSAQARPSFTFSPGTRPSRSPGSGGFGGGGRGFGGGFTDPADPPAGVDAATWAAALTACRSLLPTFTGGQGTGGFNNSAFTAYRNCLSDHGMNMSAGPGGFNNFNTADPTVAAALKACAPLRPTGRPTASPSPTG